MMGDGISGEVASLQLEPKVERAAYHPLGTHAVVFNNDTMTVTCSGVQVKEVEVKTLEQAQDELEALRGMGRCWGRCCSSEQAG